MNTPKGEIIFRQIINPRPSNWEKAMHWYVEYHDSAYDMAFPLGVAYVSAHSGMRKCLGCSAMLDFILVADDHRRKGVGKALIAACRERWPDIHLGDAISESGAALLHSVSGSEAHPC